MTASTTDAIVDAVVTDVEHDTQARSRSSRLASLVRLLGPTTLLSALLYYYGYVTLRSYYTYFGISLSVLDLAPADYVRRSPDTLFKPIGYLTTALVVLFAAHVLLTHQLATTKPHLVRRALIVMGSAAIVVGGAGLLAFYNAGQGVVPPLCLVVGVGLLEYSLWLLCRYGRPSTASRNALTRTEDMRRGLVIALVVIGTFWAVNGIARDRGEVLARGTERSLVLQPRAVVYSAKDLRLPGPDVKTFPIDRPGSAYAFLSNGLRPLLFANHRWFLLPAGWRHDNDATVIVLRDDTPGVRVDLAPATNLVRDPPDGRARRDR